MKHDLTFHIDLNGVHANFIMLSYYCNEQYITKSPLTYYTAQIFLKDAILGRRHLKLKFELTELSHLHQNHHFLRKKHKQKNKKQTNKRKKTLLITILKTHTGHKNIHHKYLWSIQSVVYSEIVILEYYYIHLPEFWSTFLWITNEHTK